MQDYRGNISQYPHCVEGDWKKSEMFQTLGHQQGYYADDRSNARSQSTEESHTLKAKHLQGTKNKLSSTTIVSKLKQNHTSSDIMTVIDGKFRPVNDSIVGGYDKDG